MNFDIVMAIAWFIMGVIWTFTSGGTSALVCIAISILYTKSYEIKKLIENED